MIRADALTEKFRKALDDKWGYIWGTAGVLWTKSRQNNLVQQFVSKYGTSWQKNSEAKADTKYNSAVYGSKWIDHNVADCSGLFAWAFKQLGGSIAHGSNSIWDRYTKNKGKLAEGRRTDGKELLPGTAVFTGTDNDHPHIGLYAGSGKVIEAANTQAGVVTSNINATKWKYWGELRGVDYDGKAEEPVTDSGWPVLKRGSKGTYVRQLQQLLLDRGYKLPKYGADGDFGSETEAAVKQFQRDWGLTVDGIVGPQTLKMLQSTVPNEKTYTVTIRGLSKETADEIIAKYGGDAAEG